MGIILVALALLMVSHIPYPLVPRLSFRTARGILGSAALIACAVAALTVPGVLPLSVPGTIYRVGGEPGMLLGLLERLPEQDPLLDDVEVEDDGASRFDISIMARSPPGGTPRPATRMRPRRTDR
jgi:hypothetical protein